MEQTLSETCNWSKLSLTLEHFERLGYSRRSRIGYRAIWDISSNFPARNQLEDKFSADSGGALSRGVLASVGEAVE